VFEASTSIEWDLDIWGGSGITVAGKYGEETVLTPLDDSQEKEANDYIVHRFVHENK